MISESDAARGSRTGAVLTALALVLTALTIALDIANAGHVPEAAELEPGWLGALTGLAQVVPGALLLRQLPRHPVAWILVASGTFWVVDSFCGAWTAFAVYTNPGLPGAAATFYVYQRLGAALLLGLPLLLLVFPDGRLPHAPTWRRLSVASIVLTALLPVLLAVVPTETATRFTQQPLEEQLAQLGVDPFSISAPYPIWQALLTLAYTGIFLSLVVPLAVVVHRYRAAGDIGRAQLRWLVWAGVVDLVAIVAGLLTPSPVAGVLLALAVGCTSAAVVVAVTRHRLYAVDRLISATVLYAVLAAAVVLVDAVVFALAGAVLGQRDSALVAIAVVAAVYAPLRDRISRALRRLRSGSRDDPYAVVSALAEQLEGSDGPDAQLGAVVRAVGEAFRSPYVRIEIDRPSGERQVVQHGSPDGHEVRLPVVYRGEQIGRLTLSPAGRTELTERDQRLLGDVVRQAAAATRASELSEDLQAIRERLVSAREEERRRLRRDLHDSVGPSLAAVSLRIETARNVARRDPAAADRLLEAATEDVAAVLADVRRLAHDLRPPALDELGLVRALEELARRLEGHGLTISVRSEKAPLSLPAAVEVAAYRIVAEAVHNVVRHAGASRCVVSLRLGEPPDGERGSDPRGMADDVNDASAGQAHATRTLTVEVRDDGHGIRSDVVAGVGMLSLRERAAELGGTATVSCPDTGGTVVRASLPLGGRLAGPTGSDSLPVGSRSATGVTTDA
ncbi:sensor histidine kinase [Intrasporangium oryzae]|uniref:sensor histidine kinase n=1 Tax=Intrasporangium oryzae TaxID=412687 RepID=UPI0004B6E299|nr:sensor histidine kinase [Intrasporangium oryzae]